MKIKAKFIIGSIAVFIISTITVFTWLSNLFLRDFKVLIVGGHTAAVVNERGAKSYYGKWESEFNDGIVALFADRKNQLTGIKYILAPTTKNLTLQEKIKLAESVKPDLYIEIHHDSGKQDDIDKAKAEGITSPIWKSMSGFCVLYYDDGDGKESKFPKESRKLAELISEEMIKAGFKPDTYHSKKNNMKLIGENKGLYNRVRPNSLFVLRNAISPAVILECGYIINPIDEEVLSKPETREKIVRAINSTIKRLMYTYRWERDVDL